MQRTREWLDLANVEPANEIPIREESKKNTLPKAGLQSLRAFQRI